jgi:hypothetical protein
MSVCSSASLLSKTTERIPIKFGIGDWQLSFQKFLCVVYVYIQVRGIYENKRRQEKRRRVARDYILWGGGQRRTFSGFEISHSCYRGPDREHPQI